MKKGLLLAFTLAASFTASASTITYSYLIPTVTVGASGSNFNYQMFDAVALGIPTAVLNTVSLNMLGNFTPNGTTVQNGSGVVNRIRVQFTHDVTFSNYGALNAGAQNYSGATLNWVSSVVNVAANSYAIGQTKTVAGLNHAGSLGEFYDGSTPADLASFIGVGTDTLNVQFNSGFGATGFNSSNNINLGTASVLGATLDVTYDYTVPDPNPIPEPSTMAIAGSALLGLGLMLRRKK